MNDNNGESRHDKLVDIIANRLEINGWRTKCFTEYHHNHKHGEVDLYACKNGYTAVFEIKSRYKPKSFRYAKKQLWRADNNLFKMTPEDKPRNIFNFIAYFTHPMRHDYKIRWVRRF